MRGVENSSLVREGNGKGGSNLILLFQTKNGGPEQKVAKSFWSDCMRVLCI